MRYETSYRMLMILGALLVFWRVNLFDQTGQIWIINSPLEWMLWVAALGGLGFTWWARIHLGTLWSGNITRKANHRIVDSGPYGLVRHPIYTGLMVALFATALDRGSISAIAGAAVLTVSLCIKARLEERFLTAELGVQTYGGYRRRVPMLVPFWPAGGP